MSKQLVMKDRLVSAARGQNTENFISGILMLSHLHTKLLHNFLHILVVDTTQQSQTELVMQGLKTLRAARRISHPLFY